MKLDSATLFDGIVRHSFLPVQKKAREELPPCFDSSSLTVEAARSINQLDLSAERRKGGFDAMEYRSTRFSNVPRILSVPHPKAHIDLAAAFAANWDAIKQIGDNENSLIRPLKHDDGRIVIMDYDAQWRNRTRTLQLSFGKKFLVKTDISNCFPSLYSHALGWALVGFDEAKSKTNDRGVWFNQVDACQRRNKRNETAGVPIGPASSNISAEIILEVIDRTLREQFSFVRFIDDYTAYCDSYEQAEEFIRLLSLELSKFKLNLNIGKTSIVKLPQPINESWIGEIKKLIPRDDEITASAASDTLDAALRLQQKEPSGSILKFAAKSLLKKVNGTDVFEFIAYLLKLSYHYPILIPVLSKPLATAYEQTFLGKPSVSFENELRQLLHDNIKYQRSDAICWLLFYMHRYHPTLDSGVAREIASTGDSMSLALLTEFDEQKSICIEFAQSLNKEHLYSLDQHWMLLYQLYKDGDLECPYGDGYFETMRNAGTSFIEFRETA